MAELPRFIERIPLNPMIKAVSISHVHKLYGDLQALCDVDFEIEKGCFFGLIGPNGAGKSTLINVMAGLVHATSGTIQILGHDVRTQWRRARQALGIVPQELAYDPFFTAKEMLRLQSGYFGFGPSNYPWIDELLEILNLTDKSEENLASLSGGMKRRVLIAQAMVHKPQVVVLDEPTAGVDVELRRVLWDFTRFLNKNGHTIILTTHYLEEAESLCERIGILNHGRLIAHDKTEALLDRYPYRLLNLSLKNEITEIPDGIKHKVVSFDKDRLVLRLHKEKDQVGAILDVLAAGSIKIRDLRTDEPGLEEVFLALTGEKND